MSENGEEGLLLYFLNDLLTCGSGELTDSLKSKVLKILSDFNLKEHSNLNIHGCTLFDVALPASELTYAEQITVKESLERHIKKRCPLVMKELDDVTEGEFSRIASDLGERSPDDGSPLAQLTDQLSEAQAHLRSVRGHTLAILKEWLLLKAGDALRSNEKTVELLSLQTALFDLQSKITEVNLLIRMYTQTEEAVSAYNSVYKDILQDLEYTKMNIQNCKDIIMNE